jgi:hypothetical protein
MVFFTDACDFFLLFSVWFWSYSPKDDIEFTIVRETIRRKLEASLLKYIRFQCIFDFVSKLFSFLSCWILFILDLPRLTWGWFLYLRMCFRQVVCKKVTIDPKKMIRKLPRIQHLFAQLTGRLRSEEDEVTMIQFKLEIGSIFTNEVTLLNSYRITKVLNFLFLLVWNFVITSSKSCSLWISNRRGATFNCRNRYVHFGYIVISDSNR